jgi:SAM-dependent methyltransferase
MNSGNPVAPAPGDESRWEKFVDATRDEPPWPRLVRATEMFEFAGDALDVGPGAGRDTAYLLNHGWRVTAIDSSPSAIKALERFAHHNLRVVATRIEDFVPSAYDLVNAQFSLPFIPSEQFSVTVQRLRDSVRPNGVLAATFFGKHDEWNVAGTNLSFSTRADIEELFHGWDVIELTEVEEDGRVATGAPKHWHVYHLIARRPAK